jgi:spore maturation protein CgeB
VRALVVHPGPAFSVSDVYRGIVRGLRANGVTVGEVNLGDRLTLFEGAHLERNPGEFTHALSRDDAVKLTANTLKADCYDMWPDLVIVVSGFFITAEVWGALNFKPHHTVFWGTESPYEDAQQGQAARYVDTVILNDPTNLDSYRADINERTYYLPHSYDPEIHHPGPPEPVLASDFCFVGTGFPSRVEFFEKVDWSGLTVRMAGNWQVDDDCPLRPYIMSVPGDCLDNEDTVRLYRSAKVNANLYRKEVNEGGTAEGWAIGPREVELAATESFFLREPRPEGDALFPMMPTFTTPVEFSDALRWWLAHPDERASAAARARAAIADRTFTNTAAELLRLVDGVPHRRR